MNAFNEHLQLANSMLDETGNLARRYFMQDVNVNQKSDASPVTIADIEIEALIRERITSAYPQHGILGEEHASINLSAEYCWVVDPIDGTKSFISGMPIWGTLLALLKNGRPLLGIVDVPALRERYVGTYDGRTEKNGTSISTSSCQELSNCNLFATSPDMFSNSEFKMFDALSKRARFRRFGGDCYSYVMLAAGKVDAVVEAGLKPYDYLPIVPVVNGAGGVITDWNGNALTPESNGRVIAAATPALHQALLEETSKLEP
ncbi:histidinol-phosphatase [Paraburkholderia sp. Ac-20340]|uniref:histidinol-phosphatase n=1 Tax=Paraburkholderia sp. Ac-20340 TaxID=2703888 RepID=UPI0019805C4C|nr:histidinol-phosphatase [Paraburkholderia sp. Ac-20340]MBN3854015.1 histidinol-phosphatase [Paraburkholderia sp. Ac-20340]